MRYISVKPVYTPIFLALHEEICIGNIVITIYQGIIAMWMSAAIILLFRYAYKYLKSMKGIIDTSEKDENLTHLLKEKHISVLRNAYFDTPMSAGIINRYIIIPEGANTNDIHYMIKHELSHIKSGDLILKGLLNILQCVLWFNPFIYVLCRDIEQTIEMRCDKAVTSCMDNEEKAEYLEMILSVFQASEGNNKMSRNYMYLFGNMESENIKERFEAVGAQTEPDTKNIKDIKNPIMIIVVLAVLFATYLFSSKQYQAAERQIEEIEVLSDITSFRWEDKESLLKMKMTDYDVDGDYINPVTGIAGMLMTDDMTEEERHKIIRIR